MKKIIIIGITFLLVACSNQIPQLQEEALRLTPETTLIWVDKYRIEVPNSLEESEAINRILWNIYIAKNKGVDGSELTFNPQIIRLLESVKDKSGFELAGGEESEETRRYRHIEGWLRHNDFHIPEYEIERMNFLSSIPVRIDEFFHTGDISFEHGNKDDQVLTRSLKAALEYELEKAVK